MTNNTVRSAHPVSDEMRATVLAMLARKTALCVAPRVCGAAA